MSYLIGIPLLAILAVLQSSLLSHLHMLDGRPDLVPLAVIAWALTGRWREAMIWGFAGGLLLDLFTGLPFGVSAITLIIVAYLVTLSEGRFWEAHLLMPLAVTLVCSILYHLVILTTVAISGREVDFVMAIVRVILPSTFLNLLLALPATSLAASLQRTLYPPEVEI
jgi:rod shape-determining protein MreD